MSNSIESKIEIQNEIQYAIMLTELGRRLKSLGLHVSKCSLNYHEMSRISV